MQCICARPQHTTKGQKSKANLLSCIEEFRVNPKSHKLVLDFIPKNKGQIKKKAAALGVDWQDYSQEIAFFILERSDHFDARLGSFTAFVFGHVDKR
jgi:hypothetical protein